MTSNAVGFKKIAFAPRMTGAAVGGLLGGAAAPEDQGTTGAMVGAGMGYGVGALADHLHKHVTGPAAKAAPAPAPAGSAGPPALHPGSLAPHMKEIDDHLSGAHLSQQIDAAAKARGVKPGPGGYAPGEMPAPGSVLSPERKAALPKMVAPARQRQRPLVLPASPRAPVGGFHFKGGSWSVGFGKLAEYGVSVSPQGASYSTSSKDERLPGMNRWVPRGTLQRAFEGFDEGYDEQALTEEAGESGHIAHPAIGAALGAALAHYGVAPSLGGKIMGGLAGAGLGSVYNNATRGDRETNMREALKGVHGERGHHPKHPNHGKTTANESVPMVVSAAGGDT